MDNIQSTKLNETHINGTFKFANVGKKQNGWYFFVSLPSSCDRCLIVCNITGTYVCGARDSSTKQMVLSNVTLLVLDKPQINLDFIKAIGATRIFLNWTVSFSLIDFFHQSFFLSILFQFAAD